MKSTYTAKKTILASSVFLGMALGPAHAERCFNLAPFVDILRVSALNLFTPGGGTGSTHTVVVGSWIATGAYVIPIVGSQVLDLGTTPPTTKRLGFHGSNNQAGFFNGNADCLLDGTPGGVVTITCIGIGAPFTNTATLTPVTCSGQPPSTTGKALGAPK